MSILEILEDHRQHDAVAKDTRFYCLCGWVSEMPRYRYGPAEHRAHVAQVLEQHEREAKAVALEEAIDALMAGPEANLNPDGTMRPPHLHRSPRLNHKPRLRVANWLLRRAAQYKTTS